MIRIADTLPSRWEAVRALFTLANLLILLRLLRVAMVLWIAILWAGEVDAVADVHVRTALGYGITLSLLMFGWKD